MAHNHTFRVVTDGTVAVQQQRFAAKAVRLPKTDLRYWEAAVYHRTYTRNAQRFQVSHYSARIQHQGRQEIFALQTGNKTAAAGRARPSHTDRPLESRRRLA